jgi:hypothetical protein
MGRFFSTIATTVGIGAMWAIMIGMLPGWVYWLWMAIHLGSFAMFLLAFLGPLGIVTSFLGLWSLVFGVPYWLLKLVA